MEWGDLLLKAHPNLLGATNKNLLKSVKKDDGRMSRNFTYELDSEGYPTKITEELDEDGNGNFETTTYTLTWE